MAVTLASTDRPNTGEGVSPVAVAASSPCASVSHGAAATPQAVADLVHARSRLLELVVADGPGDIWIRILLFLCLVVLLASSSGLGGRPSQPERPPSPLSRLQEKRRLLRDRNGADPLSALF